MRLRPAKKRLAVNHEDDSDLQRKRFVAKKNNTNDNEDAFSWKRVAVKTIYDFAGEEETRRET